jgi:tektin-1
MDFRHVRHKLVAAPLNSAHFTLSEWCLSNSHHYSSAGVQQHTADRVIAESGRLCDMISEVTKHSKAEVDNKLEERIKDIEYQREENEIQKKECCKEEEALFTYTERIKCALKSLEEQVMEVCKKCIILR